MEAGERKEYLSFERRQAGKDSEESEQFRKRKIKEVERQSWNFRAALQIKIHEMDDDDNDD
uniref:IBB domain-containing protein n=1 Tax=Elaeophora elaphi TaxID=1147741 RepID=A0A0R3S5K6_9BILA